VDTIAEHIAQGRVSVNQALNQCFALYGAKPVVTKAKGALSTFTFSGDWSSSEPVTMETTMTEADFSGKNLGVSGGMMVAAFLPKCQ
jgi:hypothetical protein